MTKTSAAKPDPAALFSTWQFMGKVHLGVESRTLFSPAPLGYDIVKALVAD